MKKILLLILVFCFSCDSLDSPPVKKSKTGICHEYGTKYYEQTKHFEVFQSIDECISSGGRLPKRK